MVTSFLIFLVAAACLASMAESLIRLLFIKAVRTRVARILGRLGKGIAWGWRKLRGIEEGHLVDVIDGDTIMIDGERCRLRGIDAPESNTETGRITTMVLKRLIDGKTVYFRRHGRGPYKRTLITLYAGDLDVNRDLVRRGMARAYLRYTHVYFVPQALAILRKQGHWQRGYFIHPEDQRHGKHKKSLMSLLIAAYLGLDGTLGRSRGHAAASERRGTLTVCDDTQTPPEPKIRTRPAPKPRAPRPTPDQPVVFPGMSAAFNATFTLPTLADVRPKKTQD